MIKFVKGNILESPAEALVNTVNTVGIMGKGIALQFKKAFPSNYHAYKKACDKGEITTGKIFVFKDKHPLYGEKWILNFPTKKHWRHPSRYAYIEEGLEDLKRVIETYGIRSIAIPPLGAGNGKLKWEKVKEIIVRQLQNMDLDIFIYEPVPTPLSPSIKKEGSGLTPARALLLSGLFEVMRHGEWTTEFTAEKLAYFFQKFGGKKFFKLDFYPHYYGPYSGKIRFLLSRLRGSYISGYEENSKPFQPFKVNIQSRNEVRNYLNQNPEVALINRLTLSFLEGYYTDYALELLSTVDFIISRSGTSDPLEVMQIIYNWNERKRRMFSDERHIVKAIAHISDFSQKIRIS